MVQNSCICCANGSLGHVSALCSGAQYVCSPLSVVAAGAGVMSALTRLLLQAEATSEVHVWWGLLYQQMSW